WDLVEMETPELQRGCEEGLLEPLDWSKLGTKADFLPAAVSECGAGIFVWSTALTYDASILQRGPKSWADFWVIKTFPGMRALRKSAN
ncbi:extracellular solute-binding protein, partial [Erwinia amylovora]|uniref:extracellular solute-binding protein n=1 Tax=Erwinia amylovora TaxID=552 RepID=UPI0020C11174